MVLKRTLAATLAVAGLSLAATSAHAALEIFSSVGGAPNVGNVSRENLDDDTFVSEIAANGITLTNDAQWAMIPNVVGKYAAPYLSGSNGIGFGLGGGLQADGQDQTRYLTTGAVSAQNPSASVQISFSVALSYIGLLWGSVDTYNTLQFFDENDVLIGEVKGSDVLNSPVGNQGSEGTTYVNINSTTEKFKRVVFTSSQYAFEFDNLAFSKDLQTGVVPLPAAAWLLLSGMAGLFGISRRRKQA